MMKLNHSIAGLYYSRFRAKQYTPGNQAICCFGKSTFKFPLVMQTLTHQTQSSLDRYDRENTTCPVPARGGWLISLKRVYHSWETEGIDTDVTEERLPAFKEPETGKSMELVSLDLINLFHLIMHDFGIPNDLPFKLQYKNEDDGEWRDIMFSDQIRIASTMFQMKQNHPTKPSTANRLVHSNMLLVSIIMDEAKAFKYEIRDSNDLSKTIPSQMI